MKTEDYLGIGILGAAAYLIWKVNKGVNAVTDTFSTDKGGIFDTSKYTDVTSDYWKPTADIFTGLYEGAKTTQGELSKLWDAAKDKFNQIFNKETTSGGNLPALTAYYTPQGFVSSKDAPQEAQKQAVTAAKNMYLTGSGNFTEEQLIKSTAAYYLGQSSSAYPSITPLTKVESLASKTQPAANTISNMTPLSGGGSSSSKIINKPTVNANVQAVVSSGNASAGFTRLAKSLGLAK